MTSAERTRGDEPGEDLRAELDALRAAIGQQQARIEAQERELRVLRGQVRPDAASREVTEPSTRPEGSSRRRFFQLAGAAAAGAAGVAILGPAQAAQAADSDPLLVGQTVATTAASPGTTSLSYSAAAVRSFSGNSNAIFAVTDAGTGLPAAIAGIAGVVALDGVAGSTTSSSGHGVVGVAQTGIGVGGLSQTGLGVIGFSQTNADVVALGSGVIGAVSHIAVGPPSAGSYATGDLFHDDAGNLFVCVQGGTPSLFQRLAGPTTAGAFTAISPQRVYDSRNGPKIGTNEERVIGVATTPVGAPVVPATATAASITLTVTDTENVGGFLSVRPAGTAWAGTSSINWFGPGQNIATTVMTALGGDRQVVVRGFNATHFIIDVTGYFG